MKVAWYLPLAVFRLGIAQHRNCGAILNAKSAVARSGLEALDYLDSGHPAPQAWVQEQFVLLDLAAKPRAELLLMIVAPVRKLVEAAQKGSR